jgi:hypothetical protein
MATASADFTYFLRSALIISRRRTDFPVPSRVSKVRTEGKAIICDAYQHYQYRIHFLRLALVSIFEFALGSEISTRAWSWWRH